MGETPAAAVATASSGPRMCPRNLAVWAEWAAASECSGTMCGTGTVTYNRTCLGDGCPGPETKVEACPLACPGMLLYVG